MFLGWYYSPPSGSDPAPTSRGCGDGEFSVLGHMLGICLLTYEKNTRSAARGSVLDSRDITIVINTKRPACGRFQAQQMMEGNEIR